MSLLRAFLLVAFGAPAVSAAANWKKLAGVAADEGNDLGALKSCDLACCKSACEANPACNSFAATSQNCYLKDKCIFDDEKAKRSAYTTWYRDCPDVGVVEATCGVWENLAKAQIRGGESVREVLGVYQNWQNCVVKATLDGQISRKGIKVAIFRPTTNAAGATVETAAGLLQGLLSTIAFSMHSGRITLVDWPELSNQRTPTAFQPLDATLQSNFQQLEKAFQLQTGGRRMAGSVTASIGPQWLCDTDLLLLDNADVLVFESAGHFAGFAEYNSAVTKSFQKYFGRRSLSNNYLASMFKTLFQPAASTTNFVAEVSKAQSLAAGSRTVGIVLPPAGAGTLDEDSDGVFLQFSDDSSSLASCLALATEADGEAGSAPDQSILVVVDQDAGKGVGGSSGILLGVRAGNGQGYEFAPSASPALEQPLQQALTQVAILAACDDLVLPTNSFGLSETAPIVWKRNDAAPHRPAVFCGRTASGKPHWLSGNSLGNELPECTAFFTMEKHEEVVMQYVAEAM